MSRRGDDDNGGDETGDYEIGDDEIGDGEEWVSGGTRWLTDPESGLTIVRGYDVVGGDELPGFDDFFRANYRRLRGLLQSRGAPLDLVDEVVDFAFAAIMHRWPDLRDDNLKAYLNKIASRRLSKRTGPYWAKLAKEERAALGALHAVAQARFDQDRGCDLSLEIRKHLDDLQPRERAAVVLRYIRELEISEIADVMDVRSVTVRGYIHRGLKRLGAALGNHADLPTSEDGKDN